jgi:hypothetical protein
MHQEINCGPKPLGDHQTITPIALLQLPMAGALLVVAVSVPMATYPVTGARLIC